MFSLQFHLVQQSLGFFILIQLKYKTPQQPGNLQMQYLLCITSQLEKTLEKMSVVLSSKPELTKGYQWYILE